jgi:hypothetical protein
MSDERGAMTKILATIVAIAATLAFAPAGATVVTGSFSGVVTAASDDADPLFNSSGSIVGDTITGTYTYDTAVFGSPLYTCSGACAEYDSTDGSIPVFGNVLMTETINGVTLDYFGTYFENVFLAVGSNPTWAPPDEQLFSVWSEDNDNPESGTNVAEINIAASDLSPLLVDPALDPADPLTGAAPGAVSYGVGFWTTPSSDSNWQFQITSANAEVPEPASFWLMSFALATFGMACRFRLPCRLSGRSFGRS